MRRQGILHTVVLAGAASLLAASQAGAACDTPLATRSASSETNVLIIFDTSGSMNEAMFHADYDPLVTYPGNFDPTETYNVSTDGNRTPQSFKSNWPSAPSAYLVNSDGGEDGRYFGNYLNWIYFAASDSQRTAIPQVTRVQLAKPAINTVVGSGGARRFGVMVFNGDDGGTLIAPLGTPVATIQSEVDAAVANSWTPSAETMVDALNYFKTTGATAPFQYECQKSFVIFVSDGHPTKDLDVPSYLRDYDGDGQDPGNCTSIGAPFYPNNYDCSGYLDDVTKYMFDTDLRTDLNGKQNVITYVVGFNIYAPVLENAGIQGGGEFYSVDNVDELTTALSAALASIENKAAAGSPVSVVSSEGRTNNRLYRARYESVTWQGYVEAFNLPYHAGDSPVWEAGSLLKARDPDTRKIYTSTTGTNTLTFVDSNASTLRTPLGAPDVTAAKKIIKYARGTSVNGTRDRQGWKLGDVVDSGPVAAGVPSEYFNFLSYPAFRAGNATRKEVIYVGANDGMLHCFNADTGDEKWGYIPKNQLSKLDDLMDPSYCHYFYVNMMPAVFDIYTGGAWKTVVIGGQERGGSGLFALNVTNPDAMAVMWDVDIASLKGSWNKPEMVRDKTRNAFVLVAGTGYDEVSGQAKLLAIDAVNGAVLSTFNLGTAVKPNLVTSGTAIDMDFDGYDDRLYLADLAGRVWRVNLKTNPWTINQLYSGTQPIQGAPVLSMDDQGRVLVYFGTGKFLVDADRTSTTAQALYGLIDDGTTTVLTRASLVNQTSTITTIPANKRGWYIDLTRSGERANRSPALVAGVLYYPTFRPYTGVCQNGGESWLFKVDFQDGSAPDNQDGSENNTTSGREQSMGSGILSSPAIDLVNEDLILQSSDATVISQDINVNLQRLVVRSWRQVWNREVTQ